MVVAGGGGVDREFSTLQYGGQLRDSFDYRAYAKDFNDESLESLAGRSLDDGWHSQRGGFRADDTLTVNDSLTFQGDIYSFQWWLLPDVLEAHTISDRSSTQLDVSFDRYTRLDALGETRDNPRH
jgi:hypothetical protein